MNDKIQIRRDCFKFKKKIEILIVIKIHSIFTVQQDRTTTEIEQQPTRSNLKHKNNNKEQNATLV